jgi:hypothetical protein
LCDFYFNQAKHTEQTLHAKITLLTTETHHVQSDCDVLRKDLATALDQCETHRRQEQIARAAQRTSEAAVAACDLQLVALRHEMEQKNVRLAQLEQDLQAEREELRLCKTTPTIVELCQNPDSPVRTTAACAAAGAIVPSHTYTSLRSNVITTPGSPDPNAAPSRSVWSELEDTLRTQMMVQQQTLSAAAAEDNGGAPRDAMREYFHLATTAVKMLLLRDGPLAVEDRTDINYPGLEVPADQLYQDALRDDVPFFRWHMHLCSRISGQPVALSWGGPALGGFVPVPVGPGSACKPQTPVVVTATTTVGSPNVREVIQV